VVPDQSTLGVARRETQGHFKAHPKGEAEECQKGKRKGDSTPRAERRFLCVK